MKHWATVLMAWVLLPAVGWAQISKPANLGQDQAQRELPVEIGESSIGLAAPVVNAKVISSTPAWIGQMVQVQVQLLRDSRGENGKPFFGETHVRGGIVQLAGFIPIGGTQTIDGVEYLEQVRVYQVFPQYGESIEFPPIEVAWFEGDTRKSAVSEALTIPLQIQPGIPEEAWLAVPKATLTQDIRGDLNAFRVGDAVTRTVTIEATDTDAMMLPPAQFEDIPGLTRYTAEPRLSTSSNRGQFVAKRVDRVTYVANRWGFYQLPPIRVAWFETSAGAFQELVAEPTSFRARWNPDLGLSCLGTSDSVPRGTVWVLLLVVMAAVVWRWIRARPKQPIVPDEPNQEPERFKALIAAIQQGDAKATLNAAHAWFGVRANNPVTLERFADPDQELALQVEALEAAVVGPEANITEIWQPNVVERGAKTLRYPVDASQDEALPSMNPGD